MSRLWLLAFAGCGRFGFVPLDDTQAVDASTGSCGTVHAFCDDFDRTTPIEAPWSAMNLAGGALRLATDDRVSPPQSLVVDVAYPITGTVELVKQLPAPTTAVRLTFDIALELTTPAPTEVDLVQLRWTPPPAPCTELGFYLVRHATNVMVLQETYPDCGGIEFNAIEFPAPGTGFHKAELDVTLGPVGVARVQLRVDGSRVFDELTARALPAQPMSLLVGAPDVRNASGPWRIRYDDVVVDLE